jgi:hypothetical protein
LQRHIAAGPGGTTQNREPVQKAKVDAQLAALQPLVENANARSSLRKADCATKAGVDEQARCYILYRNNGKV